MSWYYSVTLVNAKDILHSAVIVKIILHPHRPEIAGPENAGP